MDLVPSSQFHRTTSYDSFQSSFSSFHGARLQSFRYRPSVSLRKHILYATQNIFFSDSFSQQNPARKSKFGSPSKSISIHWIDKWSHIYQENNQKQSIIVFNYRSSGSERVSNFGISKSDGISGGGGGENSTTMENIVERLRKFRSVDDGDGKKGKGPERVIEEGSVEEAMLPSSKGGLSVEPPLEVKSVFRSDGEIRFPWEKPIEKERRGNGSVRMKSKTSVAELTLPDSELRRLRKLALQTQSKIRVGGAGVTQPIMDKIHEKWKTSEIVRLRVEGAAALNMKKMHDMLEKKTGGLVIWRSGTAISLYRGVSYEVPFVQQDRREYRRNSVSVSSLPATTADKTVKSPENASHTDMGTPQAKSETNPEDKEEIEPVPEVKYEDEVDKLLDSLGPRYTDWQGCNPLPVDADMLPGFVPGYQPPYRILPYGVRPYVGLKEATSLRRLAKVLPPHFALGRSRQLQGLAVAMIKLWERSSIAKIALKRGVQLTTSERMAEDLKKLTGGILLSRTKDFLVFYRGKDFLSPDVTEALLEKERLAKALQDEEEQARLRVSAFVLPTDERENKSGIAGTLGETLDADARWGKKFSGNHKEKIIREGETLRHARVVQKLENKLAFAERKLRKAEAALCKVEAFLKPSDRQADPDSITDEERFMFRKLGLKMKAFLLLGRRGVFDGTVENMHLHWKYRELVKIIVKSNAFDQVKKVALALEAESGGVLVSVDKMSKGYAVIVFRGKDYQRPSTLRPKNLLTKRKALARSIELQRREGLLNHISAVQNNVEKLRYELYQMETVKDQGDEKLYETLESAYVSDDDNSEEEGDEAYLGMYNDGTDGDYESDSDSESLPYDFQDQVSETEPEPGEHAVITATFTGADEVEKQDMGMF